MKNIKQMKKHNVDMLLVFFIMAISQLDGNWMAAVVAVSGRSDGNGAQSPGTTMDGGADGWWRLG